VFVQAAVVLAYGVANSDELDTYLSLFCPSPDTSETSHTGTPGLDVMASTGLTDRPQEPARWTKEEILGDPQKHLFKLRVSFWPEGDLEEFASKPPGESRITYEPETLYLNSAFLDLYHRGSTRLALVLIHCSVLQGLAHLLYIRLCLRSSTEGEWSRHSPPVEMDYGTEIEYRLFGGRLLTTRDLTGLRIECRDGKTYEVDCKAFHDQLMFANSFTRVQVEKLEEIDITAEQNGVTSAWLGLNEINRTQSIIPTKLHTKAKKLL
jgi:hypothetical protein